MSEKAPAVRSISDDTWTVIEYGERLFQLGGAVYGARTTMWKAAVSAAALDVLQQDVSKTPIEMRRYTERGSEVVRPSDHPVAALLKDGPNSFMSTSEFLKVMVGNLAVDSEYFLAARRLRDMSVEEFAGIPRDCVTMTTVNATTRKLYYDVSPGTLFQDAVFGWARGRRPHTEIAHIKRRTMNGLDAISTSAIAESSLTLLKNMQTTQNGRFKSGGIPQVAFTFPDGLTDEQYDRLKKGLTESMKRSRDSGTPIILEGSGGDVPKVERLSETAADSDFVKANINAAMDVVRYFRVPPHKVYLMESIKYDNMDSAERVYVDDALCPYFRDIEDGLSRALLTKEERREFFFKFDVEAAYAMDPSEWQKITESRWKNGMITRNEMRRMIGENELGPDGDIFMASGNFVLTDAANNVIMRAGGNAPGSEKADETPDDESPEAPEKSIRLVR